MLHLRRLGEAMGDQLTPLGEVGGAAEVDRVVLHRVPADEQTVAARLLDTALQRHAGATLGAAEERRGGAHARLELLLHARLHVDLGDFEKHRGAPLGGRCRQWLWPTLPATGLTGR